MAEKKKDLKKALQAHVENRPDRDRLIQRNIIQPFRSADPKLQSVMRQLMKSQLEDELAAQLKRRTPVESLIERGILLAPPGEPWDSKAKKEADKHRISQLFAARPSLRDLLKGKQTIFKDTMMWTRQITQGAVPVPRNCHTMATVKDKDGKENLYLLGGFGTGAQSCELLVYDPATSAWTKPVVGGIVPTERYSHTCATVGSQIVLFGGFSVHGQWLNDLHLLDTEYVHSFTPKLGKTGKKSTPQPMYMWYQLETKGTPPCPRAAHSATVVGKRLIIFAGNDGKHLFNDLFILDTETMQWSQPTMSGPIPSPRAGHTSNLTGDNKMVVFGGGNQNGPVNDLHILDLEKMEWSKPKQKGTPPSPRAGHTAFTVSPKQNQILVFGGGFLDKAFNDLHLYDVETSRWSRPSDTGQVPIPRAGHTMTMMGDRLHIFGGGDADAVFNDMHVLDCGFWKRGDFENGHPHLSRPHLSRPHLPPIIPTLHHHLLSQSSLHPRSPSNSSMQSSSTLSTSSVSSPSGPTPILRRGSSTSSEISVSSRSGSFRREGSFTDSTSPTSRSRKDSSSDTTSPTSRSSARHDSSTEGIVPSVPTRLSSTPSIRSSSTEGIVAPIPIRPPSSTSNRPSSTTPVLPETYERSRTEEQSVSGRRDSLKSQPQNSDLSLLPSPKGARQQSSQIPDLDRIQEQAGQDPDTIDLSAEQVDYLSNKISSLSNRYQRLLESTRKQLKARRAKEKREEEQLYSLIKALEQSRKEQYDAAFNELAKLQNIVAAEMRVLSTQINLKREAGDEKSRRHRSSSSSLSTSVSS